MATSANWRCADCDTYNEPAETSCTVCAGTRREAASPTAPGSKPRPASGAKPGPKPTGKSSGAGAARPAAKRPGGAGRPPGPWRCSECDTNNARSDLSCITCGTHWKPAKRSTPKPKPPADTGAGAKKTTPRRTPPTKPTPRSTASSSSSSTPRSTPRGAPSSSSPPRSTPRPSRPGVSGTSGRWASTAPGTARPRTEEGVFFPSSASTGYRPATPPRPEPVYTPGPRPHYIPPRKSSKSTGCLSGCFGIVVLFFLVGLVAQGCDKSSSGSDDSPRTNAEPSCPGRIAAELPEGDGAELVQAFRTKNKQITLCRTASGTLYYYGEFSDGREQGIAMKARTTSNGYEARNGVYRYVVHGGVVTVYESGRKIGEERLQPEPSPS